LQSVQIIALNSTARNNGYFAESQLNTVVRDFSANAHFEEQEQVKNSDGGKAKAQDGRALEGMPKAKDKLSTEGR
jgi:hypothetical protein